MNKLLTAAVLIGFSGAALAIPMDATLLEYNNITMNQGLTAMAATANNDAAWQFDVDTGVFSMVSGTFEYEAALGPNKLFTHTSTGASVPAGDVASADTWVCTEGTFGLAVGAHMCGNVSFGENFFLESTIGATATGTTVILGGDDTASGPPQSIAQWDDMTLTEIAGAADGWQRYVLANGVVGETEGFQFVFDAQVVPVPGAVWLFGSALGLAGFIRRRKAA